MCPQFRPQAHFTAFLADVGYHESAWRLAAPAGIKGRTVEYDPVGVRREHLGIPLPQRLVVQLEPVGPPLRLIHAGSLSAAEPPCGRLPRLGLRPGLRRSGQFVARWPLS